MMVMVIWCRSYLYFKESRDHETFSQVLRAGKVMKACLVPQLILFPNTLLLFPDVHFISQLISHICYSLSSLTQALPIHHNFIDSSFKCLCIWPPSHSLKVRAAAGRGIGVWFARPPCILNTQSLSTLRSNMQRPDAMNWGPEVPPSLSFNFLFENLVL